MRHLLSIIFAVACLASALVAAAQNRVVVSKQKLTLWVIDGDGDTIFRAPVSVGANYGNKQRQGDDRTPEGEFKINEVLNSSSLTYDFKDGYGPRKGAYGPYFLRLNVPNNRTIGIHGTCFPSTVGSRSSHGCVRMLNEDITRLRGLVGVGTRVTILPDNTGAF